MNSIAQKFRRMTIRTMIIASALLIVPLAISPALAGKKDSGGGGGGAFCPCFSSTIIDAELSEAGGSGVGGILNGTDGGFTCYDTGDDVFLSFSNADLTVNLRVFGETFTESPGPGCGWSGRPLDTTAQEATECQNEIKQSWAWKVLACPVQ